MSAKQPNCHASNLEKVHIDGILSIFKFLPTSKQLNEEIKNTLCELDNTKELSLILQALPFLYHGSVCFNFGQADLYKIRKLEMSFISNKKEDRILVLAKEIFGNHSEFLSAFSQQLALLAMTIVFKNDGLPYYGSDPKRVKEQEFTKIVERVFDESQLEGIELDASIVSAFYRRDPTKWHQELIIKVPYLIAKHGSEKAAAILSQHQSTKQLLEFYRAHVTSEIQTFVAEGESERIRQNVYRLNRKLGLLGLYQKNELKINHQSEVNLQVRTSLLVYCSSYPYLSFMRIAWTLNCREPTNKFYVDNVFCDLDAFHTNHVDIFRVSNERKTLFLVYPDDSCPTHNLKELLEKFLALNSQNKVILITPDKIFKIIEKPLAKIGFKLING